MPQCILPAYYIINYANINYNHIDIFVKNNLSKYICQPIKTFGPEPWWDCISSPWDDPRWEDVAASLNCRNWQNVCTCMSFRHQHVLNQQHGIQVQLWGFLTITYCDVFALCMASPPLRQRWRNKCCRYYGNEPVNSPPPSRQRWHNKCFPS
jgi:hypothetical protein